MDHEDGPRGTAKCFKIQQKLAKLGDEDMHSPQVSMATGEAGTVERLYELLDHTTSRNSDLLNQKGELSRALQEKQTRYRALALELERVYAELSVGGSREAEIQIALAEAREQLTAQEAEAEAAAKVLEERDAHLAHSQNEVADLRQSIVSLEAELTKSAAEAVAIQGQIASIEAQRAELVAENTRLQQESHLLQSCLHQRDEEISQTLLELESAKAQLALASVSADELAASNTRLLEERKIQRAEIEKLMQLVEAIENEKDETARKLVESEQWVFTLAGARTEHERQILKLGRRLAEEQDLRAAVAASNATTAAEILHLRDRLKEVEIERDVVQSELASEMRDELSALTLLLKAAEDDLRAARRQYSAEVAELSKTHSSAIAGVSKSHSIELAERYDELATVTRLLREAERNSHSEPTFSDVGKGIALALQALPWWWAILPKSSRDKRRFARLRNLKLFDGERYLQIYPDVAAERMDPLEHYLRHGIAEGRKSAID